MHIYGVLLLIFRELNLIISITLNATQLYFINIAAVLPNPIPTQNYKLEYGR